MKDGVVWTHTAGMELSPELVDGWGGVRLRFFDLRA